MWLLSNNVELYRQNITKVFNGSLFDLTKKKKKSSLFDFLKVKVAFKCIN